MTDKLVFKPEDFCTETTNNSGRVVMYNLSPESCADEANAILNAWLGKQPVRYRWKSVDDLHDSGEEWLDFDSGYNCNPSHMARLVCIEEIS